MTVSGPLSQACPHWLKPLVTSLVVSFKNNTSIGYYYNIFCKVPYRYRCTFWKKYWGTFYSQYRVPVPRYFYFVPCPSLSLANQALITSSLSRKDERVAKSTFPQRQQVSFPAFFLTLHAERQRGNLW